MNLTCRFREERVAPQRAFGERGGADATAGIHRGIGWRKGAERRLTGARGKPAASRDQEMPWREIRVEARERTESIRPSKFRLRSTRDVAAPILILSGLLQKYAILHERAAGLESRGERR